MHTSAPGSARIAQRWTSFGFEGDSAGGTATQGRFDRITLDPERMNGQPCIRSLCLTVRRVLEALATYPPRRRNA